MTIHMEVPDQNFEQPSSEWELDGKYRYLSKSQNNIRLAMSKFGIELRYDEFNDRMLVRGLAGHSVIDDAALNKLWLSLDLEFSGVRGQFLPPIDFFRVVVEETARQNSFHPVRDYLSGLVWDGVPRIDRWLVDYGGAEASEYVCAVGAIVLLAAVRRVRKPGCKFDEMLILESPQGNNKSKALQEMAVMPEWFSDDLPLNADSKRVIEQTRGKWIVEAAELSGMRKAQVEHLKSLLSRQVDLARLAWGRMRADVARQFVVFGSTNSAVYLKDLTGNRRFWPVKVTTFDADAIKRDRDQLWAEAAAREATGASIHLEQRLWAAAGEEQRARTADDPWFEFLGEEIGDQKGKIACETLWAMLEVPKDNRTQDQNTRLGAAMKAMGFERKKLKFDGRNKWCYARGDKAERELEIEVPM